MLHHIDAKSSFDYGRRTCWVRKNKLLKNLKLRKIIIFRPAGTGKTGKILIFLKN
jgi:hypothetical protein